MSEPHPHECETEGCEGWARCEGNILHAFRCATCDRAWNDGYAYGLNEMAG